MLDDSEADAELIRRELNQAGLPTVSERVNCENSFAAALENFAPDVVLSDYSLAHFDARSALALLLRVRPTTPLIIVTGCFNGDKAIAWSGGSEPAAAVNPGAVAAMAEAGIDIAAEFPKPWAEEFVLAADVVVTMGCGDACPLLPGKRYEDWELDDPAGLGIDEVRAIRDSIGDRVRVLLAGLGIAS